MFIYIHIHTYISTHMYTYRYKLIFLPPGHSLPPTPLPAHSHSHKVGSRPAQDVAEWDRRRFWYAWVLSHILTNHSTHDWVILHWHWRVHMNVSRHTYGSDACVFSIHVTRVAATQRLFKWTDIRALYSDIEALYIIALYAKPAFILMHISTYSKTRSTTLTLFCDRASCSDIRALYPYITPLSKKVWHTTTFILINIHTCSKAHFGILTSFY